MNREIIVSGSTTCLRHEYISIDYANDHNSITHNYTSTSNSRNYGYTPLLTKCWVAEHGVFGLMLLNTLARAQHRKGGPRVVAEVRVVFLEKNTFHL